MNTNLLHLLYREIISNHKYFEKKGFNESQDIKEWYSVEDIQKKSIEIRFSKEGITLTCTFDKDGNCDESFLFPDDDQLIEDFVGYLIDHHDYSFMRSRFMLGNCYLKIKELKEQRSDICLVFFQ